MAAGEALNKAVFALLDIRNGKTVADIAQAITHSSPRAVRYAVANLIKDGKAFKRGRLVLAMEDIYVDIVEGENRGSRGVRLGECFPDVGYLEAKADLLTNGVHRGGGGAAAAFELKLADAQSNPTPTGFR